MVNFSSMSTKAIQNRITQQQQRITNLNKRINQLDVEQHGEKGEIKACGHDVRNYVMSWTDPEHYGPMRFPDCFSEMTSLFLGTVDFELPFVTDTDLADAPQGSYYCEIHPDLENVVLYLENPPTGSGDPIHHVGGTVSLEDNENHFGFWDRNSERFQRGFLSDGAYNPVVQCFDERGIPQIPAFATPTSSAVLEKGFWYLPNRLGLVQHATIAFTNTGGSGTLTFTQVDRDGNVISGGGSGTLIGANSTGILNVALTQGSLGRFSWNLRLGVSSDASDTPVMLTGCVCTMNYVAGPLVMSRQSLPDIESLRANVEKSRITALSGLATFIGPPLTVEGKSCTYLYKGGIPAQYKELYDYDTISVLAGSYGGKILDGTYAYWEPADMVDMSFTSLSAVNLYKSPYILKAGNYNGAISGPTGLIKLRVIIVSEYTTRSQLFPAKPSPVCPELINTCFRILSGQPNAMENGKHMDRIAGFFKSAGKAAASSAKWLLQHRQAIAEVAEAAAPLLLA